VALAIIASTSLSKSKSAALRPGVNAVALPRSEVKNRSEKSNERKGLRNALSSCWTAILSTPRRDDFWVSKVEMGWEVKESQGCSLIVLITLVRRNVAWQGPGATWGESNRSLDQAHTALPIEITTT
jgi:hypothetical protein